MNKVKKIAIIGLGSIGRRHAQNALSLGFNVIGYDPSKDAYTNLVGKIQTADSEQGAIENSDAVIIASPHKYHKQSLEYCVLANKPVLVEKPIATDMHELENTLNTALNKNIIVACGFNLRFRSIVEQACKEIRDIGNIYWARFICASYLPDWRPGNNYLSNYTNDTKDGGIIFDIAHELDLAQYLFGQATVVSAFADNSGVLGLMAEDRASLTLKHTNGVLSHIYLDYTTRPRQRGFEVAGERGIMHVDLAKHNLRIFGTDNTLIKDYKLENYNANEEYIAELKDFIQAIESKGVPRCSGKEGLNNLKNIMQARKLAELDK